MNTFLLILICFVVSFVVSFISGLVMFSLGNWMDRRKK